MKYKVEVEVTKMSGLLYHQPGCWVLVHLKMFLYPMGTDQFLNQISTLIFGWEIVDFETMINQKSTSQPQFNQKSTNYQPNFNHFSTLSLIFHWISNLVDFWLNCGWEVDFWLIIVSKSTISQPNINVEDGWEKLRLNVESTLRSWSVPTG